MIESPDLQSPIAYLDLHDADDTTWLAAEASVKRLAAHVDLIADWDNATVDRRSSTVDRLTKLLAHASAENPSTLFDCYLLADSPPDPSALREWRAALPYWPGYLDRVAVYRRASPDPGHQRVSPRSWLVLPWTAQATPDAYAGIAEIIWQYDLSAGETPPFGAWAAADGAGVWLRFLPDCAPAYRSEMIASVRQWEQESGRRVWVARDVAV